MPIKERSAMKWFYTSLVVLGISTLAAIFTGKYGGLTFLYLLFWYSLSGRPQAIYVKEKYGKNYERRSWGMPLLIGTSAFIGYAIIVFVVDALVFGTEEQPPRASSLTNEAIHASQNTSASLKPKALTQTNETSLSECEAFLFSSGMTLRTVYLCNLSRYDSYVEFATLQAGACMKLFGKDRAEEIMKSGAQEVNRMIHESGQNNTKFCSIMKSEIPELFSD